MRVSIGETCALAMAIVAVCEADAEAAHTEEGGDGAAELRTRSAAVSGTSPSLSNDALAVALMDAYVVGASCNDSSLNANSWVDTAADAKAATAFGCEHTVSTNSSRSAADDV